MTETSYNPNDYTVDQVNEYLATADDAERSRVLGLEAGGQNRKGIVEGVHAVQVNDDDQDDDAPAPVGLETTGNPNDLATPGAEPNDTANIAHQEGAPEALTKVADEAAEVGYLGDSPEKPDYSQANPSVMNQDA